MFKTSLIRDYILSSSSAVSAISCSENALRMSHLWARDIQKSRWHEWIIVLQIPIIPLVPNRLLKKGLDIIIIIDHHSIIIRVGFIG